MLQIVVYVLSMVILYVTDCGICVVDGDTLCYMIVVYVLSMVILYVIDCGICVVDGDTLCYRLWYMWCRW